MEEKQKVKYCLEDEIYVLWIDEIFDLAKVYFIKEDKERVIGLKLITNKPCIEKTLSISTLAGGI
jgi:hypothetical protein